MSTKVKGKSKQRARAKRRTQARRPAHDSGALRVFDPLCEEMLVTQGRDIVDSGDPLQAELWASHVLGLFGAQPIVGENDPVAAIGGRMVAVARRSRTAEAFVCLTALAALAGGRLRTRAREALAHLASAGVSGPGWADQIGAAARVVEAMDWTGRTLDAPVSPDFGEVAPLVAARLRAVAGPVPETVSLDDAEREALVQAFLADPAGAPYAHDPAAWFLLDAMVHYRCDDHGRDPRAWSSGVAELFLLDFVPRKLSARRETLERAPEVLRAWVPWGAERAGIAPDFVAGTLAVVDEIEAEFHDAGRRVALRTGEAGRDAHGRGRR